MKQTQQQWLTFIYIMNISTKKTRTLFLNILFIKEYLENVVLIGTLSHLSKFLFLLYFRELIRFYSRFCPQIFII